MKMMTMKVIWKSKFCLLSPYVIPVLMLVYELFISHIQFTNK